VNAKNRAYICHTYYHLFVSIIKELNENQDTSCKSTLILSNMSGDFRNLEMKIRNSKIFTNVLIMDEKHPSYLKKFNRKLGKGNWITKLITRINYWKHIAKEEIKYINIDFLQYDKIYVFCDGDPIGMYLNYHKIYYISVEDGLNSIKYNLAKKENAKFFILKLILSKLGIIFIKDGYSKYSLAIEVNDKKNISKFMRRVIEVPRVNLTKNLTNEQKKIVYDIFLEENIKIKNTSKTILVLTQNILERHVRLKMYTDIVKLYCEGKDVYIKPHPFDNVDYSSINGCTILNRFFPIEIFNFRNDIKFDEVLSVYSASVEGIIFANKKIALGVDFLNNYEDEELHKFIKN
jgi:hypothetical protein